jgi:glycosyltransferase involved in cell wall biosynthesis
MEKLLIITPHLSTGGAPQFTLNKIILLLNDYDIVCVEYDFLSADFVVQRNKIKQLLGVNFISLTNDKTELLSIIKNNSFTTILMEEFPENFMDNIITKEIYSNDRTYKIIETTHSSINTFGKKRWLPDRFSFVSKHSIKMYGDLGVEYEVIEYPIDIGKKRTPKNDGYKHVLNVGLFTEGKNQGYAFEMAQKLLNHKIKFHFVGNLAGNFKDYWDPIVKNTPENCIVWGESKDVHNFLSTADLFLFTSKFELNPLVIKEAIEYELPILMFNLETYCNTYDNIDNITFLTGDVDKDVDILLKTLFDYNTIEYTESTFFNFTNRNQLPQFLNHLKLTNKGVELGSFKGEFSKNLTENWFGKLYMVDVWRPLSKEEYDDDSNHKNHVNVYEAAINNISGFEDKTFMLRMKGEFAKELFSDGSLDFVYIDANHSYNGVKEDLNDWYPKVKKGGLVMGHDYLPSDMYNKDVKDIPLYLFPDGQPEKSKYAGMFGVNPAVDEFALEHGYTINKTDEFLATWWFVKK